MRALGAVVRAAAFASLTVVTAGVATTDGTGSSGGSTGSDSASGASFSYVAAGDIAKLGAYLTAGGSDSTCLGDFERAIELDLKIEALSKRLDENRNRSISQRLGNLEVELAGVEHEIDQRCSTSLLNLPEACPMWVKGAVDLLVDGVRFGFDAAKYEALRAEYFRLSALRRLYKIEYHAFTQIPRRDAPPDLRTRIRSKKADLDLNLKALQNVRAEALVMLQKCAQSNPGMLPDNGIQLLLDCAFPPPGQG